MIRILLDEGIDIGLRAHFIPDFEVETVMFRGWKGLPNGELLQRAQQEYDVLVTLDRSLPRQQNLTQFDLGVLILRGHSSRLEDLTELMPQVNQAVMTIGAGEAQEIPPPKTETT